MHRGRATNLDCHSRADGLRPPRPADLIARQSAFADHADFGFLAHQPLFNRLELHNCIPSDLPEIIADQNQISQVLTNLLLNAAQATPPGGSITVTAETAKAGSAVELRVRDTGTGVPADILPHVFEPFFTTKRGTGNRTGPEHHAQLRTAARW